MTRLPWQPTLKNNPALHKLSFSLIRFMATSRANFGATCGLRRRTIATRHIRSRWRMPTNALRWRSERLNFPTRAWPFISASICLTKSRHLTSAPKMQPSQYKLPLSATLTLSAAITTKATRKSTRPTSTRRKVSCRSRLRLLSTAATDFTPIAFSPSRLSLPTTTAKPLTDVMSALSRRFGTAQGIMARLPTVLVTLPVSCACREVKISSWESATMRRFVALWKLTTFAFHPPTLTSE